MSINAEDSNEEPALRGSLEFIIKHSCNILLGKNLMFENTQWNVLLKTVTMDSSYTHQTSHKANTKYL